MHSRSAVLLSPSASFFSYIPLSPQLCCFSPWRARTWFPVVRCDLLRSRGAKDARLGCMLCAAVNARARGPPSNC